MFTGILGPRELNQGVEQCYVVSYEYSKKSMSFITLHTQILGEYYV